MFNKFNLKLNIEKQLSELTDLVRSYYLLDLSDSSSGHELVKILQKISALNYYLTTCRTKVHEQYTDFVIQQRNQKVEGKALAHNTITSMADHEFPEMYTLRKIVDNTNELIKTMKATLYFMNGEKKI